MKSFDDTWEKIHSEKVWGQYPGEAVIRFVARNYYSANPRKEIKILDFGCGDGATTWYLLREGFDVYAFDGSESAIKNTRAKLEREFEKYDVDLRVRDALELDYPENFFDGVIDNACICHNRMMNIQKMYEEIARILKPGGKLFTSGFGKETSGYGTGREIEKDTFTDITKGHFAGLGTFHFTDESEMKIVLEKSGFQVLSCDCYKYSDQGAFVDNLVTIAERKATV